MGQLVWVLCCFSTLMVCSKGLGFYKGFLQGFNERGFYKGVLKDSGVSYCS